MIECHQSHGAQLYFNDLMPCNTSVSKTIKFGIEIDFMIWYGFGITSSSGVKDRKIVSENFII